MPTQVVLTVLHGPELQRELETPFWLGPCSMVTGVMTLHGERGQSFVFCQRRQKLKKERAGEADGQEA